MKKTSASKPLSLSRETLRRLDAAQLVKANGGFELRDNKYTPKCPPYTDFTCTCIG